MRGHVSVVLFGAVAVLYQVIPNVPLPHDLPAGLSRRFDLHNEVGPQIAVALQHRVASGGNGLVSGLRFPHGHQHVTVGKSLDVVVQQLRVAGKFKVPDELAVPGKLLNAPPGATSPEHSRPPSSPTLSAAWPGWSATSHACPQQVPVLKQVNAGSQRGTALPRLHDSSLHVDQVRARGAHRSNQGVPLKGAGIVLQQPHLDA